MQTTKAEIIELIKRLPLHEKRNIYTWLENQIPKTQEDFDKLNEERRWLDRHYEAYVNQWICLNGDQLIAADIDFEVAFKKAVEGGIESPNLSFVEDEPRFYFSGGLEALPD